MALIESWVKGKLESASAVTQLVGQRVYPVAIPQGKDNIPAVVYWRARTVRVYSTRGNDRQPVVTIRVHAISEDYQESKTILDAIRPLFDGVRDPSSSFGVARCFIADEADAYEAPAFDNEVLIYKPYLDLEIAHKE